MKSEAHYNCSWLERLDAATERIGAAAIGEIFAIPCSHGLFASFSFEAGWNFRVQVL
jgi:hypothetical protein